jgi:hypothetical protein
MAHYNVDAAKKWRIKVIVAVFLAGRVVAGEGLGDSRRVSPTPVRRCPTRSLRLRRL